MRKETIDWVVEDGGDYDGDKIETSLSDEEVQKLEAQFKIQSELTDIKYHFRSRAPYKGAADESKYSKQKKEKDSGGER